MVAPSLRWSLLVVLLCVSSLLAAACDVYFQRTHYAVREVVLRLVSAVCCANFASVAVQAKGLIGPRGILPLSATLRKIEANLTYRTERGIHTPITSRVMAGLTLRVWRIAGGEANVAAAAWAGAALSAAVAVRPSWAGFSALYVVWYAYKRGLGTFANLQWDMLLCEALLLCTPLAAARSREGVAVAAHCIRALALRLHCGAGCAKLAGDRRWRDLSAMHEHHETQPLPTPLAPLLAGLPRGVLSASTLAALLLEIGTVVAVIPYPTAAAAAFSMCVAVQVAITISGFYGYFNFLSVVLSLSLLDDSWFWPGAAAETAETFGTIDACVLLFSAGAFMLHLARAAQYSDGRVRFLGWLDPWLRTADHTFSFCHRYSLFSQLTGPPRREIVIEVANSDGEAWSEVEFRYKVGDPGRLKLVPPLHMPRLDWRLWLLAQYPPAPSEWLDTLLDRLADGSGGGSDVRALFEPRCWSVKDARLRARIYGYRFRPARREGRPDDTNFLVWERFELPEGVTFPTKRE